MSAKCGMGSAELGSACGACVLTEKRLKAAEQFFSDVSFPSRIDRCVNSDRVVVVGWGEPANPNHAAPTRWGSSLTPTYGTANKYATIDIPSRLS